MHLKSVNIKGYKNLRATPIRFSCGLVPIALIGNNGSGKSNLIEALTQIFIGLFFEKSMPGFDFELTYEAHNKEVEITKTGEDLQIKVAGDEWTEKRFRERIRETDTEPPFPSLIFGYYSGTSDRLEKQFDRYTQFYSRKLQKEDAELERRFVFADIEQANRVLLGLIAHGHGDLLSKVNVRAAKDIELVLYSPEKFNRDEDEPKFWGTVGVVRDFLADIDSVAESTVEKRWGKQRQNDRRHYYIDEQGMKSLGALVARKGGNVYSLLELLFRRKILSATSFNLVHAKSKDEFDYMSLSEGEKQLLSVIGGLTLSMQDECLVLLDEPDTHLNPAWSWEYIELLRTALVENQQRSSTVLLATHDPIMISGLQRHEVLMATVDDAGELSYKLPVRDPKGQGVANVLTSEYFGLPSSLDKPTQTKLNRRLELAYKDALDDDERAELGAINEELKCLGLHINFRDPLYKDYEKQRVEAARN